MTEDEYRRQYCRQHRRVIAVMIGLALVGAASLGLILAVVIALVMP